MSAMEASDSRVASATSSTMEATDSDAAVMSATGRSQLSSVRQKWTLGELIGRGAFGTVHRARDSSGKAVAIKRLLLTGDAESCKAKALKQLQREVELLRDFQHPNIVRYLGTQRSAHELLIVMELLTGGTVAQLITERKGSLPTELALRYTRQLFAGLSYLHDKGVVHRDIKGSNLLLERPPPLANAAPGSVADVAARGGAEGGRVAVGGAEGGTVKIADFGSARLLQHGSTLQSEVSTFAGTIYWMAPEVLRGAPYGRRADVWSAGGTLLEMVSGAPPWAAVDGRASNQYAIMYAIASSSAPPPMEAVEHPEVRALLERCFERNPTRRPTVSQLLAEEPLLGGERVVRHAERELAAESTPERQAKGTVGLSCPPSAEPHARGAAWELESKPSERTPIAP